MLKLKRGGTGRAAVTAPQSQLAREPPPRRSENPAPRPRTSRHGQIEIKYAL
ncbi:hypothetical protein JYU34_009354 [Plutella xylostella]|uniref:Uncharacterized protein n=1 Tax=Plutella xylostella TaxID=51655 RepID=A0ABQ7QMR3_PLUXY|nr:hypothetical protein JYU34_009354 [Plutella xylostella]